MGALEAGRDAEAFEITVGGLADVEAAKRLQDMGASRIVMPRLSFDPGDIGRTLGELSDSFISKLA